MQIFSKPLKEIHQDIRAKIKETLTTSEELKDVQSVVYGEKVRAGALRTPAIWILPEPYRPDVTGGRTVNHDIRLSFVTLVKHTDPEKGLEEAQDLALTVYDALRADKTLGGTVFDVIPYEIDPAYEMGGSTQIYWSAVTFDFRLKRRE